MTTVKIVLRHQKLQLLFFSHDESKKSIQHKKIILPFLKTLSDMVEDQDEAQTEDKRLDQAEEVLGDHVTGGVVQSWRQVQRRLGDVTSEGNGSNNL